MSSAAACAWQEVTVKSPTSIPAMPAVEAGPWCKNFNMLSCAAFLQTELSTKPAEGGYPLAAAAPNLKLHC